MGNSMLEKAKSAAFKAVLTTHADEAVTRDGDFVYTDGGGIPLDAVVRAILAAIREPNDAMWDAGHAALEVHGDSARASCWAWVAMLDSILKEGT